MFVINNYSVWRINPFLPVVIPIQSLAVLPVCIHKYIICKQYVDLCNNLHCILMFFLFFPKTGVECFIVYNFALMYTHDGYAMY